MDTKTAWQTLRDYAEGRIDHAWAERCPNTEYGHDIRDSDCPVCQALDAVQGCLAQIEEPAQPVLYVSADQLAGALPPEKPGSTTATVLLPVRKTPGGKFTQPLYAGAAPAAVAPQGEYPHLPQSVGDVTDFGDGKVDIDWGHPAPVGGTRLYSADQMRAYVDADRVARAGQPAAVTGPALALVERQALEALCAVAVAAFHAADDSSDNGNIIEVQRADFEALDAALDLLDELPDDQPGYTMTPGAKAKWALRRLLDAAPALEAHAAPAVEALRALMSLVRREAPHLSGKVMGDADAILAGAALAAAPQAPAAPVLGDAERLAAARQEKSIADYWRNRVAGLAEEFTTTEVARYLADQIVANLYDLPASGVARPAAPAAPAVDASDTALLDAMERERIAVIPEFEGPWDAQIFGEDEATLACGSGTTPRKAIAEALASLEARKVHDAAQAKEGGA